jgi:hypothetical protein
MPAMIEKMNAVAPTTIFGPYRRMPVSLNADAILNTLQTLGLTVPPKLTAAASKGEPLRASEHRYSASEVDAAMAKNGVTFDERLRFKYALDRNGILG